MCVCVLWEGLSEGMLSQSKNFVAHYCMLLSHLVCKSNMVTREEKKGFEWNWLTHPLSGHSHTWTWGDPHPAITINIFSGEHGCGEWHVEGFYCGNCYIIERLVYLVFFFFKLFLNPSWSQWCSEHTSSLHLSIAGRSFSSSGFLCVFRLLTHSSQNIGFWREILIFEFLIARECNANILCLASLKFY